MPAIDPNKYLPPELTVESVDDILYRIGLSFDSVREPPKRKSYFNPYIIFTITVIYITKISLLMPLSDENVFLFKLFGDFVALMGIRPYLSINILLFAALAVCSQTIHYYNYRNGIKPTFLRVFQMMSGLILPKSLGLTNQESIKKICKLTRFHVKLFNFNNNILLVLALFILFIVPYATETSLLDTIIYGLPNSIIFMIVMHHIFNFVSYQLLFYYIICFYLKVKISELNESLLEMIRRKRFLRIRETLQSFDSLYSEINEYNTTFWSKFLLIFWVTISSYNVFLLYIVIFCSIKIIIKIVLIYALIVVLLPFLFIIFTASSVTYSAHKSYKTLNSLFISYSQHNKQLNYYRILSKFKLGTFIERVGEKRVGFSCWKLFTINYFRCYEVIAMMSLFFLKIVDFKH